MANTAQDKEIQQYRDLMPVPDQFESGFGWKMIAGALFIGFMMVPGSIYLSLFIGQGLGPAAQWVTVIIFAEVARRSMKDLRKQEVYLLFYMTGIAMGGQLHGGVLSQLLWNQYLVQSQAAIGMGIDPPSWWVPSREILAQSDRTFLTVHWLAPLLYVTGMMIIGRVDHLGLGYALYRLTAHVEKLPFPMAPVGALGIVAMSETRDDKEGRWRWRCFSIGGVMGLGFGLIYIGIPSLTGTFFGSPVQVLPIPWLDLTPQLSTADGWFPAMPFNIVFDATLIILGMVLPFWAVIGGFIGLLITLILNPVLFHMGVLTNWEPGMKVVDTIFNNHVDFYLSFQIGLMLAIFAISIGTIFKPLITKFKDRKKIKEPTDELSGWRLLKKEMFTRSRERGDISILLSLGIYLTVTFSYIGICVWLMPGTAEMNYKDQFPWEFFLIFALIYQPIMSYAHAKLEGLIGQAVSIPLVREAAFLLSGYKGSAIWFAPIPINDYGFATRSFRVLELTGTKLTDIIRVELVAIPILLICSFLFSEMLWRIAPIPSSFYPFTVEVWDLQARNFCLTVTATSEGTSQFLEAIKFDVIGYGLGAGVIAYTVLSLLSLPTFLVFGVVRGMSQSTPGSILPELFGALLGRFYLEKKIGKQNFKKYIMVVFAGFSAGMGLIAMAGVALALIVSSTSEVGY